MTLAEWNAIPDLPDDDLAAIEAQTLEVGRQLVARAAQQRPSVLQRRWWDERLMDWAMRDETVKVQLFRFVDVLPMLRSADVIYQHLYEYLGQVRDRLPPPGERGAGVGSAEPAHARRSGACCAAEHHGPSSTFHRGNQRP